MSDPILVIALAGQARAGKDTVARYLTTHHEFFWIALADGIRATFASASGPTWKLHKELDSSGKSLRWMLQTMGTECREDVGAEDHWIDQVAIAIRYLSTYHPTPRRRFVIPDVRYPREVAVLRERLGLVDLYLETWRVDRPDGPTIAESGHSSETSLGGLEPDRVIWNVHTLAYLSGQVEAAIEGTLLAKGARP